MKEREYYVKIHCTVHACSSQPKFTQTMAAGKRKIEYIRILYEVLNF